MEDPAEQIELIGRLVIIDIQHGNDNASAYVFKGVITQISQSGKEGRHGYLILKGSSPTIMLERGRRMDIYSDMTLHNIFSKLIDGVYTDYMKNVNNPTYENKVDFLMQYNETDWAFLQRIAYLYGENLYYSGSEILFGNYREWESVKLTYDKEITDIQFTSKMLPNSSISYQYIADQDTLIEKQSPDKIENSNSFLDKTAEQNRALTVEKPAKAMISAPINSKSELDELVKRDKTRTAAQTIVITGKAKTYEASIGRLITISMPDNISNRKELGTYRVIKSVHRIDENNRYINEFEAVPASLQTMPVAEPQMPVVDSILGKVTSNEDPKGLGRVLVDFPFANQYNKTWIRVMTPGAGSSEEVSTNRGMIFIPEKGDQVMVGFEHNDSGKPFVMGSMFHGKNTTGGGIDNHIKTVITRSGHTLEFDDSKSALGITIKDKKGNFIHLDTNGKSIEITAPQKLVFNSKDIEMNATNNLNINVGNNLFTDVNNTYSAFSKTFKNNVSRDMHLYSNTAVISSTRNIQLQSDEVTAMGMQKMTLHSDNSFIANSLGIMDLKSSDAMTLAQDAQTHEVVATEEIAVAIVQFRQKAADARLYGFDWLRIQGEPGNDYETIVESGVESVATNASGETVVNEYADKAATYRALKQEYNSIPIKRDSPATGTQEAEYFVPRMTLFPPNVDKKYALTAVSEPKTEVELEIWIEILKKIDKLELDYDKTLFEVSDINLTNKEPKNKEKLSGAITLKCLKEFSRKEEIKVWAYPAPAANASTQGEASPKFLAGKLIVYPNDQSKRKKIRVALVSVKTDWRNINIPKVFQLGVFPNNVPTYIQHFTNQSLIECSVLKRPLLDDEMDTADIFENSFILDLRRVNDYHYQYDMIDFTYTPHKVIKRYGKYISNETEIQQYGNPYSLKSVLIKRDAGGNTDVDSNKDLYNDLKNRFCQKYPNYTDCYLIFAFDLKLPITDLVGQAEGFRATSSLIVKQCDPEAAVHELLHCIGLAHPFRDIKDTPVLSTEQRKIQKPLLPEQKFVFDKYLQDNIMDYPDNNGVAKERTWSWQWKELNSNLK